MTTVKQSAYRPSAAEMREVAARIAVDAPGGVILLDKSDLAAMTRTLADIEDRRAKMERSLSAMGAETSALRDQLDALRLQLD